MVEKRKISTDKYVIAGVITFLIFSLGLTLGLVLEEHRYNLVEDINREQEVKYLSLQLQYLFLSSFSNYDYCPTLSTTLKESIADLSSSLSEVIIHEEEDSSVDPSQSLVQRRYALDNIRYWLLAMESKKKCEMNTVPILYFYTTDCPSCPNQGTILSHFKTVFEEKVLIFPINLNLRHGEPMVEIMMSQFNVTKYPTLVIDNKKYEGVVRKEQLQKIICKSLKGDPECS